MAYRALLLSLLVSGPLLMEAQVRVYDPSSGQSIPAVTHSGYEAQVTPKLLPTRRSVSTQRPITTPSRAVPTTAKGAGIAELYFAPSGYNSQLERWVYSLQQWQIPVRLYMVAESRAAMQSALERNEDLPKQESIMLTYQRDWRGQRSQSRQIKQLPALWYRTADGQVQVFNPQTQWQTMLNYAADNGAQRP